MSFKKFIEQANDVMKFALEKIDLKDESYSLTEPAKEDFGDLSCNVSFLLTKKLQKSPKEIASMLVEQCVHYLDTKEQKSRAYVASVIAHESGYINLRETLT